MSWSPGARVDRYVLDRRLGAGAMGAVYLARDADTGNPYAIKAISLEASPRALERFQREGQAQAASDAHPNVARVRGAGVAFGHCYLVMDLLEGGDLKRRLEGGSLPADEAARIGAALARGLAHVHAQGVLHRDLKPANVMFDGEGTPQLVDFGIARLRGQEGLTRTGDLVGTPVYMAPEQLEDGQELDERTDVYGLGAVLYHCLTGRPPFDGDVLVVLNKVMTQDPTPPRSLEPSVPEPLERIVLKALAKDPAQRYPTADALAGDLERFLGGDEVAAEPTRRASPVLAGAVLAGLGLALTLGFVASGRTAIQAPETPSDPLAEARLELEGYPARTTAPEVTLAGRAGARVRKVELRREGQVIASVRPEGDARRFAFQVPLRLGPNAFVVAPRIERLAEGPTEAVSVERYVGWTRATVVNPADGSLLVRVEPQVFTMGTDERGYLDQEHWKKRSGFYTAHQVTLTRPYYIGKLEVTWKQYLRFASETKRKVPDPKIRLTTRWEEGGPRETKRFDPKPGELARLPIYSITWKDAAAYCAWAGLRLPTEAEWAYALRGPTSLWFPWGNAPPALALRRQGVANLTYFKAAGMRWDGDLFPAPVDKYRLSETHVGCLGMVGNVSEWVQDVYAPFTAAAQVDPCVRSGGSRRVIRGGNWRQGIQFSGIVRGGRFEGQSANSVGFRVARDAD